MLSSWYLEIEGSEGNVSDPGNAECVLPDGGSGNLRFRMSWKWPTTVFCTLFSTSTGSLTTASSISRFSSISMAFGVMQF